MFYFLAFPSIIITMFYKLLFPEVQSFYEVNWLPYSNYESWVKLRQQSQLCDPGIRKIEQIHKITFLLEINLSEKVAIFSESSYQFWKCSVAGPMISSVNFSPKFLSCASLKNYRKKNMENFQGSSKYDA